MSNNYSTLHYLFAMLKKYEIKNIVANPGTQNSCFNAMIQEDSFFNTYSVIDERSAAYVATGIIRETQKPVVITCTGATASRNYLSAMTEAYYSHLPLIAITFLPNHSNDYSLEPQRIDRSVTQNDVKALSVDLPLINSREDEINCMLILNAAFITAVNKNLPVHINCPANLQYERLNDKSLPDVYKTDYYENDFSFLKDELKKQKFAIFIGSHCKFSERTINAISKFSQSWDIPVLCDHTSKYTGNNKVLVSKAFRMIRQLNNKPNIIIDIGNVSGNYDFTNIFENNTIVWRVSKDGKFQARNNSKLTKLFCCEEDFFFDKLTNDINIENGYYKTIKDNIEKIQIPELPLSNPLICQYLSKYIPNNSSLHCAILNSLRCMNFFELDNSIDVNCNVGGFGIDGGLSTLVGQSIVDINHKCFGLFGDTAFFYDMNILGNHHISNNLRILLVNNGKGIEFRFNMGLENHWGDKTDVLVASGGHNKNGAKGWVESCGFEYMSAKTKEEFIDKIDKFCNGDFDKPVLFEVFTQTKDEQDAINLMWKYNKNKIEEVAIKIYKVFKG